MEDTGDLVSLETSQIMDKAVVNTVKTITETGSQKYREFFFSANTEPFCSMVSTNSPQQTTPVFSQMPEKQRKL